MAGGGRARVIQVGADKMMIDARERAVATLECIADAVLSTDQLGYVTYLNRAARAATGWSLERAAGRPLRDVLRLIDTETGAPPAWLRTTTLHADGRMAVAAIGALLRPDGSKTEVEYTIAAIQSRSGQAAGAVIVFRDVGLAVRTSRQMSALAQHDPLTGLLHRTFMRDRLTAAIALARRHRKSLAVAFLDIDGFKHINDSLGHAAGDDLLQTTASRLRAALRESDNISRHGGDEFVVVLSEIEHVRDARSVAAKLSLAIAAPHRVAGGEVAISVSIGMAIYPDHGKTADTLIAHADAAMYDAKRAGPGGCRFFSAKPGPRRAISAVS